MVLPISASEPGIRSIPDRERSSVLNPSQNLHDLRGDLRGAPRRIHGAYVCGREVLAHEIELAVIVFEFLLDIAALALQPFPQGSCISEPSAGSSRSGRLPRSPAIRDPS